MPSGIDDLFCANCGSDDVDLVPFDFGIDPETGYRDTGDLIKCHTCGAKEIAEFHYPEGAP